MLHTSTETKNLIFRQLCKHEILLLLLVVVVVVVVVVVLVWQY